MDERDDSRRSDDTPKTVLDHPLDAGPRRVGADDDFARQLALERRPCGCCRRCWKWATHHSQVAEELQRIEVKLSGRTHDGRWGWVDSVWLNIVFSGLIFLNSACIGLDIELADEDGQSVPVMIWLESFFLICFWVELTLRVLAHGPRRFCVDPWGPFDFGVTLLGTLDAWVLTPIIGGSELMSGLSALRTMRLLRLFRILRIFRQFKQLAQLVQIITGAFQALFWISLLLFLLVYASTCFTLSLLQSSNVENEDIKRLTSGIGWTIFYHLMIVTSERYLEYLVYPTTEINRWWTFYWVVLLILFNFFVVNLMVGIIVQRTLIYDQEEDETTVQFVYEAQTFRRALLTLFELNDANQDGVLDTEELLALLQSETMIEIMSSFGIKTDVPEKFLLEILGFQHERFVSFKRFYEGCVRMCGASKDIRSFMLQFDVAHMNHQATECILRMMGSVDGKEDTSPIDSVPVPPTPKGAASLTPKSAGNAMLVLPRAFPKGTDAMRPPQPPPSLPEPLLLPTGAAPPSAGLVDAAKMLCPAPRFAPAEPRPAVCSASLGSGFSAAFAKKTQLARKRLSLLEQRQEEMLFTLRELRSALLGSSGSVCCPNGHPLMPLGTTIHPVGNAEYRRWVCDAARESGTCRNGVCIGSSDTMLRRYHCALCRYDLCEACYQHQLSGSDPASKQKGSALKLPSVAPSSAPAVIRPPRAAPPTALLTVGMQT